MCRSADLVRHPLPRCRSCTPPCAVAGPNQRQLVSQLHRRASKSGIARAPGAMTIVGAVARAPRCTGRPKTEAVAKKREALVVARSLRLSADHGILEPWVVASTLDDDHEPRASRYTSRSCAANARRSSTLANSLMRKEVDVIAGRTSHQGARNEVPRLARSSVRRASVPAHAGATAPRLATQRDELWGRLGVSPARRRDVE